MFHQECVKRIVTALAIAIMVGVVASSGRSTIANGSSNPLSPLRTTSRRTTVPLTLSISPTVVVGGNQATATITLSAPATTNVEITLRSLNNDAARFGGRFAAIGTSQLTIPAGSVTAAFPVRTFGVANRTDVRLQALSGSNVAETTLTVNPALVRTLAISPQSVIGGISATGTITLDGLAPAGSGLVVPLQIARAPFNPFTPPSPSNPVAVTVPASVTVAPGASSATFVVTTIPVPNDTQVTISTLGKAVSATVNVLAPVPTKLLLNPASVPGGQGVIGTVSLTGRAPSGGIPIALTASSNDATVPSLVTVTAGNDRQDFKITTLVSSSTKTVTISARVSDGSVRTVGSGISDGTSNTIVVGESPSTQSVSAILSITPTPPPFTISVQPAEVIGGGTATISLTMQSNASSSTSNAITLTSDHPELLSLPSSIPVTFGTQLSTAPQTVTINATTNFATADQSVTITATGFSSSASTTLLIKQTPPIASFTLRPTTVTGGSNVIAQLMLVSGAPGPVTVNLTTEHPELVTLPAVVSVARSGVPSPFTFRTLPTTAQTSVTITASAGTQRLSQTITVVP